MFNTGSNIRKTPFILKAMTRLKHSTRVNTWDFSLNPHTQYTHSTLQNSSHMVGLVRRWADTANTTEKNKHTCKNNSV